MTRCRQHLGGAAVVLALAAGPAPAATQQECGTYTGRGCAPESRRVDLAMPSFSDPTHVVNPLFPIADLHSVVLLGREEGRPFRSETTLLPGAGTVTWNGLQVPVLISQYMAWRDGRLEEVARDRYAQADDGSVWYLGEDVIDYAHGHAVSTEGTWLAGREGPPAMIMPAAPRVGDVFRTENVPGIVFEEVTVKEVGRTVAGPHGRVSGAMVGEELHLDETTERKTFAPGYGEFLTGAGRNVEALAVAVPADALAEPVPAALQRIGTASSGMVGSVEAEDWRAARTTLRRMRQAWGALRSAQQPPLIAAAIDRTLARLARAVRHRQPRRTLTAALDLHESGLDLELRHRPRIGIDRDRMELWCQRLRVDARARNPAAVSGDAATLEWIRDRLADSLPPELDGRLAQLRAAADAKHVHAAADHAARLIGILRATPRILQPALGSPSRPPNGPGRLTAPSGSVRGVPSREYTGEELGAGVCVIVVDAPPGGGPSLHRHPYEEVFVVHAGEATFRMGDEERVVRGGEVVVVPPDTPHTFTNTGSGPLKQVDIHVSPRFVTEWLEDERATRPATSDRAR